MPISIDHGRKAPRIIAPLLAALTLGCDPNPTAPSVPKAAPPGEAAPAAPAQAPPSTSSQGVKKVPNRSVSD